MDIFIATTERNEDLVCKIKNEFPMHNFNSTLLSDVDINKNFFLYFKEQVKIADAIIVLLDKSLLENKTLLQVLSKPEIKGEFLIVQINEAPIPKLFQGMQVVELDTLKKYSFLNLKIQTKFFLNKISKRNFNVIYYKKKSIKNFSLVIFLLGLFDCVFFAMLKATEITNISDIILENFKNLFFFISIFSGFVYVIFSVLSTGDNIIDVEESKSYQKKLSQAITNNSVNISRSIDKECGGSNDDVEEVVYEFYPQQSIDALKLMLINLEDINKFYRWSRKQAKSSFVFAIVMCVAGFLLIASAIILSFLLKISDTALIISVVGGVITELISATSLLVYRTSLKQLNYYHKALHEDERFLSSINLIDKFKSPENYDRMLKEIIRSEIQLNILETKQESDNKYKVKVKNKSK